MTTTPKIDWEGKKVRQKNSEFAADKACFLTKSAYRRIVK